MSLIKSVKFCTVFSLLAISQWVSAQSFVKGSVVDSTGAALQDVSVFTSDRLHTVFTDKNGNYKLDVPSNTALTIYYSYIMQKASLKIGPLPPGATITKNVTLNVNLGLEEFTKFGQRNRDLISTIEIEAKKLERFPSVTGSVESYIKFIGGAGGNELSSGYNVRGGNFDENLIYINDIEVYRPFLVRAGQQEGLSIINPDMVDRLTFSTGGFEARYGDKMSSVLDIKYKIPVSGEFKLSASFLGSNIYYGYQSKNKRFSIITGARYRSNKLLFNSLDVSGDYKPLNTDFQALVKYNLSTKFSISWLSNMAYNRFTLVPSNRQTSFGTVSTALRLNVYMGGIEEMKYLVFLNGLTLEYKPDKFTSIKWISSHYRTQENEHFTTQGAYGLFELDNNLGSDNLGKEKRMLGVGYFIQNARNDLDATVVNSGIVGNRKKGKATWYFGSKYQNEKIHDVLSEWNYNDSAGHNIAIYGANGDSVVLDGRIKGSNDVNSYRISSYLQNSYLINAKNNLRVNAGIRHQYWSYNGENMFSPRVSFSIEPNKAYNDSLLKKLPNLNKYDSLKKRDIMYKLAGGVYYQPPFYREYRRLDGTLNQKIKAQKSIHFVVGSDLNFKAWGRQFKLVNELYYKYLDNLIPYYIDNVRIRYFAVNSSKGYATGFDTRVNGEFIKNMESWFSLSLLQTRENITYTDENGKVKQSGYIRRPTDQRINFSILFSDQLKIDKTFKMHLGLYFGGRVPYYFNNTSRYSKTPNTIPPYRRVDIGFSKEVIGGDAKKSLRFKKAESLWISFEVFNLLEFNNTVSYMWVKDALNNTYGVPNYLTGRRLNIKLILKL